jgi:hypothetical protein
MELLAIALARAAAFIEVQTWDPFGKATTLEAVQKLAEQYTFAVIPGKFADIDFQKGIELSGGRFGDIVIDKLSIFINGILIDTRSSTEDAERVLYDLLEIARKVFGAVVRPQRMYFVSQLIFRSPLRLGLLNPVLQKVADRLSESVSADMRHSFDFEPTAVLINADLSQTKIAPGMFSLERRADIPFEENTYFSNAPLRTGAHIALVEELEKNLIP